MQIRDAVPSDAAGCAAVYAPFVRDTAITFELDPPDAAEFATRIATAQQHWAWLVAEHDGRVIGYAYGGQYKSRAAYRFACEVSVYLEIGLRRTGLGRALYEALFTRLAERGYRTAVAGMTLPNDASAGLHAALGFQPVGVFRQVGWKHQRWHDVAWTQRMLSDVSGPPDEPR